MKEKKSNSPNIQNIFPNLNENTVYEICTHMSLSELNLFGRSCDTLNKFVEDQKLVAKLLKHVGRGEQELAIEMVKKNPKLLLKKGKLTDYAGKVFDTITAFQYAVWALDRHMWEAFLPYLTKDNICGQLQELENNHQNGQVYDFNHLVKALENYSAMVCTFSPDSNRIARLWEVVSIEQNNVPAHVANEFCREDRNSPFKKIPDFKETILPRSLKVNKLLDPKSNISWYKSLDGKIFIQDVDPNKRGVMNANIHSNDMPRGSKANRLLEFVKQLDKVRREELSTFKEKYLLIHNSNSTNNNNAIPINNLKPSTLKP